MYGTCRDKQLLWWLFLFEYSNKRLINSYVTERAALQIKTRYLYTKISWPRGSAIPLLLALHSGVANAGGGTLRSRQPSAAKAARPSEQRKLRIASHMPRADVRYFAFLYVADISIYSRLLFCEKQKKRRYTWNCSRKSLLSVHFSASDNQRIQETLLPQVLRGPLEDPPTRRRIGY